MSGATAAGLLQCSVGWHSITLAVSDERGRLHVIKVRLHHAASMPVRLAESSTADRLQAGRFWFTNVFMDW